MCLNYKSESGCTYGEKCRFRRVEAGGQPSKKPKKSGPKGSVAFLKVSAPLGCVSQDYYLRKPIPREEGKSGSKRAVKFSEGTWHQIKIRERKGPTRGIVRKCEPHERSPCALEFAETTQDETLLQESHARGVAWELAKSDDKLKNWDKATLYSPIEARATPAPTSKCPEEREFVVDTGASMHTLSKKELNSEELQTLRRPRNPTTVVTANGEVQTTEEAQVHVHDLDLFVTVQIPEGTLAILSLGKLCDEHGYTNEWVSGKHSQLTK